MNFSNQIFNHSQKYLASLNPISSATTPKIQKTEETYFRYSRISHKVVFMFSSINYTNIWYLWIQILSNVKKTEFKVLIPAFRDRLCFNGFFLCNTTLKERNVQVQINLY